MGSLLLAIIGIQVASAYVGTTFMPPVFGLIADLLRNWGEVNLFTRPRRFGKSLNMSMLKAFLEIGCDKTLFDGLKISQETELCEKNMGQFPVISISKKRYFYHVGRFDEYFGFTDDEVRIFTMESCLDC